MRTVLKEKSLEHELHRLSQTNVLRFGVKDGIVFPDEDVSQDPELARAALAKAGAAAIGTLQIKKQTNETSLLLVHVMDNFTFISRGFNLRDVCRSRDGKLVSIKSEGDVGHALDVLAVHYGL